MDVLLVVVVVVAVDLLLDVNEAIDAVAVASGDVHRNHQIYCHSEKKKRMKKTHKIQMRLKRIEGKICSKIKHTIFHPIGFGFFRIFFLFAIADNFRLIEL